MALKLITAATTYPVTLEEAKLHCRIESADEDTLISALIASATETAEQITGRALMAQTWELTLDAFPDAFELTRVPVQSIASVKYYDESGVQQTLGGGLYALDNADDNGFAYVVPVYSGTWPATRDQINAVAVRYVAGYANAAAVPESVKAWIKLMAGSMFENRESVASGSFTSLAFCDSLLDRHKVYAL